MSRERRWQVSAGRAPLTARVDVREVGDARRLGDGPWHLVDQRDERVRDNLPVALCDPDVPPAAADRIAQKGAAVVVVAWLGDPAFWLKVFDGEVSPHLHELLDFVMTRLPDCRVLHFEHPRLEHR
jgi:hypothetical protein